MVGRELNSFYLNLEDMLVPRPKDFFGLRPYTSYRDPLANPSIVMVGWFDARGMEQLRVNLRHVLEKDDVF